MNYNDWSIRDLKNSLRLKKEFSSAYEGLSLTTEYCIRLIKGIKEMEDLIEKKEFETKYNQQENLTPSGHNKIGEFKVNSGALMVTDPCYESETWCQTSIKNVLDGNWLVFCLKKDEKDWGNRVAEFIAIHETVKNKNFSAKKWKLIKGEVGVDSGQAGVFDLDVYNTGITSGDDYDKICNMTLNTDDNFNVPFGTPVIDYGWATSSGFGDGGYPCYVTKNSDKKVVGVKIVFIGDETEE